MLTLKVFKNMIMLLIFKNFSSIYQGKVLKTSSFIISLSFSNLKQSQHVKIDLNKKLDHKQKTIQTFNIDDQRFRKTKNENPLTHEIGVAS